MNISDSACGSLVKSIICTKCDPYSADLFAVNVKPSSVPVLCNSSGSFRSADSTTDFCSEVWNTCKDITISNSPFVPQTHASSPARLADIYESEADFCNTSGASVCFNGESASFISNKTDSNLPKGICLEKLGNGSYLNMVPHPDGSTRAFLSNQAGKIWLATIPAQGSGGILDVNESNPFLDITDVVHADTEFGLMGMALHPDFTSNGRLFVSFNCDKVQVTSCSGRCSCNSEAGCDPSMLGGDSGDQPCRYQSVVAEYVADTSSSSTPSQAKSANPTEVRRIFTMGLPYSGHHGGQIIFGPEDGFLYFMMGDGGNNGDPFNFAQNKKTLLGKIMRLDVNQMPSASEVTDLDLWGNYSIPKDNPAAEDGELQAEIWALGLRNPWRCSFDSEKPSYFFCGDVGQDTYEEVDLISKGGNYGWRVYEGPYLFHPSWTPGGNTSANSINTIFPVMGYNHSSISNQVGSAAITGGYVYRSNADPCLYGRYLYADLYGEVMWAGTEIPEESGKYNSSRLPFNCAKDSPVACDTVEGSPLPSLGLVYSFSEDNSKDVYILTSKGVYRVVRPSRCGYTCAAERLAESPNPPAGASPSSAGHEGFEMKIVIFFSSFVVWFVFV
ncbi:HIPL1 protein [Apostasia shenzhenica]|uniref:HIPL1 protein n=1 Tax=Apostasia shenzhenica TaxID=1088818 RepID=A0A2I0AAH3_9ASPA|nr:HIPL1 protein [Apostasia shenzhenica]